MRTITACEVPEPSHLPPRNFDFAVIGDVLDDRGAAAGAYVHANSAHVMTVAAYDPDAYTLKVDGVLRDADDLAFDVAFGPDIRVLLEATTLGFVELFLALRALCECQVPRIDVLYVEPRTYAKPNRARSFLRRRREFELSDEVPGYRAIPGATILLSDRSEHRGVFFLGFEERRLDVAFEDFQMLKARECDVVFGVPAFKAGWEMDAFANNVRVMMDRGISGAVRFCGANDPVAAYELLQTAYAAMGSGERMFVAPIGTKPHGVATALFVAETPGVGLLYDHPKRKAGRSDGTGTWHLFTVK